IGIFRGSEKSVFDKYFQAMNIPKPKVASLCGYTSWYNNFGNISEEQLLCDLDGMSKCDKAQIFQIDDGYQSFVGDWLTIKKDKFPHGMEFLAEKIHEKNMLAGLWLAPTLCAENSQTALVHPEWLVMDESGKKPKLGAFAWGKAYILDMEKPEVKDYLREVFATVIDKWKFDMVKLDFLYSECLTPRANKTRGQIMCETMDFFREVVGKDKYILGCGVPLGACFGKVDMCRISCDVDLSYKPKWWTKCANQEVLSTQSAINNSLFRRQLDGRAFANDPDVFFLRDKNLKFDNTQKQTLARINKLVGSVLFVSDNVGEYCQEKLGQLQEAFGERKEELLRAEYLDKKTILLTMAGEPNKRYTLDLKKGTLQEQK
ncbi:MAG: alpha-galactosidase, partial [Clostridia bacterium]